MPRTSIDLPFYDGKTRFLEWYWDAAGEMPARDAYGRLDADGRAAVLASAKYWADLERGKRVNDSRINEEHDDPLILAIKGDVHRFTTFHAGYDTWIVCDYYRKQKKKLDKIGKTSIKRTLRYMADYFQRVKEGTYYERA